MALNVDTVKFLLNQIDSSDFRYYSSAVSQLMNYLESEIKDNPIYDLFKNDRAKWTKHYDSIPGRVYLPETIEEAKSFTFDIYYSIAENNDPQWLNSFTLNMFQRQRHQENLELLNNQFIGYLDQVLQDIIYANPEHETRTLKNNNNQTVFIIHGHDEVVKTEVKDLLTTAKVPNIILHQEMDKSRHVLTKFLDNASKAGYAVAILTPDDLTAEGYYRARQNVILEIGYFIGVLGIDRVRMLVKDNIDIPSDLSGILYEKYTEDHEWKDRLLKEIEASGIYVTWSN